MDSLRLLTRGSASHATSKRSVESNTVDTGTSPTFRVAETAGQKRKREAFAVDAKYEPLDIDEIRSIQKSHHIKITDLGKLYTNDERSKSKPSKEAARLYPPPLRSFSELRQLGCNGSLVTNLAEQGYQEPSSVQLATIPLLVQKNRPIQPNLVTVAPTGSGKTLAFLIPLIDKIAKQHKSESGDRHVSAIILAPTRELVTQIVFESQKLCQNTGVRTTAFRKGMQLSAEDVHQSILDDDVDSDGAGSSDDDADLVSCCMNKRPNEYLVRSDIIVSTPLGLSHSIKKGGLPQIQDLILDEADVLLDPLFRDQTLSVWSACTSPSLSISLWSATIGASVEELSMRILSSHQNSNGRSDSDRPEFIRCIVGLKDASLPNIQHKLVFASTEAGKLTGLRQIICPAPTTSSDGESRLAPPFLIFTQTIARAESLYEEIKFDVPPSTSNPSIPRVALLNASLSSTVRSKIMTNFRLGHTWILITTDLLSRGIDFRNVSAVINYDIPTTTASYVHRAGRTGRQGATGACLTLYTREDVKYLSPIANVIRKSYSSTVRESREILPKWLVDALPSLTKETRKELKLRGVDVRRGVKESDDRDQVRRKKREMIGSKSGYERKMENRQRSMVDGSKRRQKKVDDSETDEFDGFD